MDDKVGRTSVEMASGRQEEESKRILNRHICLCPWSSTWRMSQERSGNNCPSVAWEGSRSIPEMLGEGLPEKWSGHADGYSVHSNVQSTGGDKKHGLGGEYLQRDEDLLGVCLNIWNFMLNSRPTASACAF